MLLANALLYKDLVVEFGYLENQLRLINQNLSLRLLACDHSHEHIVDCLLFLGHNLTRLLDSEFCWELIKLRLNEILLNL
jgi:hypothetical protein